MRKWIFSFIFLGGLLLTAPLACTAISLGDPQATQVALRDTVVAMQATVAALETLGTSGQTQAQQQPSPQIIVVTATSTDTPLPTPTPFPTDTPIPPPTPTQIPLPPAPPIIIVVTPTPEPTATFNVHDSAPVITGPRAGTVVEEGREILLSWSWSGLLGTDEHFDIKVRPDGRTRSTYVAWEEAEAHDLKANLSPGRYFWTVQVVKGHYQNNSGEPEDRVFEAYLSPESEPRLIIVGEKSGGSSNPPSVSQAEPPLPATPYGLAAGGLAFVLFVSLTYTRKREV